MRYRFTALACGLLLLPVAAGAQTTCNPETLQPKQNRTEMKHRTPAANSVTPVKVSVADMTNLTVPTITTLAERDQETPLSEEENKVLELTGDLWHVKLAADDCDFHLELSAPAAGNMAGRVIVEIPQGSAFNNARRTLLRALRKKGVIVTKPDEPHDLKTPLRVTVRGFAFLDAWHYSSKDPKRGHAHGTAKVATLWEIHPVWKVVPAP